MSVWRGDELHGKACPCQEAGLKYMTYCFPEELGMNGTNKEHCIINLK